MLGTPEGLPSQGPRLRRFLVRRQFYVQLVKIVSQKLIAADTGRFFISMMGGLGDLVNLFPSLEKLSQHRVIEMGTGAYPYRALVQHNPYVKKVYSPFVYKPIRQSHRRIIERVLAPFYDRVILLDTFDSKWWARGKHLSQVYAEQLGCLPPEKGVIYLADQHRREAAAYLTRSELRDFIYVTQSIRHRRPFRSWPLAHYHDLYRRLRTSCNLPILVDTTGSDERHVPEFCLALPKLDILVAAAVIERARLFVGPDSGLTHMAAALGLPTVSIHLGYPPESCRALGQNVALVTQRSPFDDPANTSPEEVFEVIRSFALGARMCEN